MNTELERRCVEVLHSKSVSDLLRRMVEFSEDRGVGRMPATLTTVHSPTLREYQFFTNAPPAHMRDFEDPVAAHVDPVSQHAAVHSAPLSSDMVRRN